MIEANATRIVNYDQRLKTFLNSFLIFVILNCIALLILLSISCLITYIWFNTILCCRDFTGIIEDRLNEIETDNHVS
ncbi:unnamed protein product [Adineta ricciae]|uniref:Uncharacterized protein n=1 Tax=Adineta ricciae TaxID=249248 RepID=A0A813PCY4_ADIRI|nr:unnamed protein product [Adineta ricciae]